MSGGYFSINFLLKKIFYKFGHTQCIAGAMEDEKTGKGRG